MGRAVMLADVRRPVLQAIGLAVACLLAVAPWAGAAPGPATGSDRFERKFSARAKRVFDVGLRAYVYGLPLLNQKRVIEIFPANQLINVTRLSNPAQRLVVLPNVDTVYTVARLQLEDGPLVLRVPDLRGRYYTMQFLDAYTNSFAYVGRRTTGTRPGRFAIVPPKWRGRLPRGVRLVRSPTPVVWMLGRTLVDGPADLPAVNAIQRGYTLTPLARLGGAPNPAIFLPGSALQPAPLPEGLAFFDAMGAAMRETPPPRRDRALMRSFRRVGIGRGLKTSARRLSAATRAGLAAAVSAGPRLVAAYGRRQARTSARRNNGWELAERGDRQLRSQVPAARGHLRARAGSQRPRGGGLSPDRHRSPRPAALGGQPLRAALQAWAATAGQRVLVAHPLRTRSLPRGELDRALCDRQPVAGPQAQRGRLARRAPAAHGAGRARVQLAAGPARALLARAAPVRAKAVGAQRELAAAHHHTRSLSPG